MPMPPAVKKFIARIRLLTLLILVASVAFMIRIGDAYTDLRRLSNEAQAEESKKEEGAKEAPPKQAEVADSQEPSGNALKSQEDLKKDEQEKAADKKEENVEKATDIKLPSTEVTNKKWEDPADTDYPEIKKEMYEDLLKRRQELDAKEQQLSQREALMEASQKEIDRKYKEMEGLRDEIKGLLQKQSSEEDARINSLVKIYSGMKPKDAARIFNTLDMDILLSVVSKMPESKSAMIIANMDADPARALTTMLAEQKQLPSLPQ